MEHDALDRRALRALGVLACLVMLATAGCTEEEDDPGGSSANLRDGGDGTSEGMIEDPRIGPDGAVQVREELHESCSSVNGNGGGYFFCSDPLPSTMAVGSC